MVQEDKMKRYTLERMLELKIEKNIEWIWALVNDYKLHHPKLSTTDPRYHVIDDQVIYIYQRGSY